MPDSEANAAREREITQNYEAFIEKLPGLLDQHRGKYALMRDRDVIDIYSTFGDAVREGVKLEDKMFSVQKITDEIVDLGHYPQFWLGAAPYANAPFQGLSLMRDSEANAAREREITRNYKAFLKELPGLLAQHRNKYALMRHREVIGIYSTFGDAVRKGGEIEDKMFSIQKITDQLVELVHYPLENVVPPVQSEARTSQFVEIDLSPAAKEEEHRVYGLGDSGAKAPASQRPVK